jgi:hypothetical protein
MQSYIRLCQGQNHYMHSGLQGFIDAGAPVLDFKTTYTIKRQYLALHIPGYVVNIIASS